MSNNENTFSKEHMDLLKIFGVTSMVGQYADSVAEYTDTALSMVNTVVGYADTATSVAVAIASTAETAVSVVETIVTIAGTAVTVVDVAGNAASVLLV